MKERIFSVALAGVMCAGGAASQTVDEANTGDFGATINDFYVLPVNTTTVNGSNSSAADGDLLRFTVGSGANVTLALDFLSGDANLLLFNAAGNPIFGDDDGGSGLDSEISLFLDPGDYLVGIGRNNFAGFDASGNKIIDNDHDDCSSNSGCNETGILFEVADEFGNTGGSPNAYVLTINGIPVIVGGPNSAEELAQLAGAAGVVGRIVAVNGRELSRIRGRDSLATRDEVLSFQRVADPETGSFTVSQSTMEHASMAGNLYTWVDLTGFHADDEDADRSFSGRGIQVGADWALSPDMVVGVSFGVQDLDSSVGAFSQDGVLRFIQPYLAYRSGLWSGEASLIYGHGDYDQTSTVGDGEGETRLTALNFTGGYDMTLDQGVTLTPTVGFSHGIEKVEGVSGTLAGSGSETVRFTEASLGAVVSHGIAGGEIFAGMYADWLDTSSDTTLVSDLLVDDGWTSRVELGVSTEIDGGMQFDASVEFSGLGGDLRQTSGALRFAFRF